jgi:hypothetical protein
VLQAGRRHVLPEREVTVPISNERLRAAFLTPQMARYFAAKLPAVAPAELTIRIEETLKFLNIAVYCTGNIPVTREIDDIWHLWILETLEYRRLCALLQGRAFIHHTSNVYLQCGGAAATGEQDPEEKLAALALYVKNYGPLQADRVRYWKYAAHLVDDCGWRLEALNDWLAPAAVPQAELGV